MKSLKILAVATALALGLGACASGSDETKSDAESSSSPAGEKSITIGYINWDEAVATTHLWERILSDKGYDVKIQQIADAGPTYVGLAKGNIDLYLDSWLPSTHETYWKKYGKDLTDLGTWYDSAPLTIAVPDYMDIDSLDDLKGIGDEVNKTIVGIEPGAGLTAATKRMLQDYGLDDWSLKTSSTAAMLATLKKETAAEKPVVVTLWRPHWAYASFPIKDLTDPKGSMGEPDEIHAIGTKNFTSEYPEITEMLTKFHLDDKQLAALEQDVLVDSKDDMAAGVDKWLTDNPDFVKSLG